MSKLIARTPQEGHAVLTDAWSEIKGMLLQGSAVQIEYGEYAPSKLEQRRKEYWGWVLRPIAQQVQPDGKRFAADTWHFFYKRQFLGYKSVTTRLPFQKRPTVQRVLRSIKDLKHKEFCEYLEKIRAHASTTYAVEFPIFDPDGQWDFLTGENDES